jgi:hypothetical protein
MLQRSPGWRHRARVWWRDYQWPVLLSLELAVLALGYAGFRRHAAATGLRLTAADSLYLTLQLITLESGSLVGPLNWQLELARFLVPAVTAYTAIAAAALLFRQHLQLLRLLFLRRHVVICGLGQKGALLAEGFRQRGADVVVIEHDESHPLIKPFRERGMIVLVGSGTDAGLLQKARLHRARALVAVTGDDGANAHIAVHARVLNRKRRSNALTTVIHVVDPRLYELLRDQEIGRGGEQGFRLELFNVFERGARALLSEFPPFAIQGDTPPHVLVIGMGRLGENLIIQAARQWRERERDGRPRITVVDRDAPAQIERLCARYPQLAQSADLVPCEVLVDSAAYEAAGFLYTAEGRLASTVVYVLLPDETQAVKAALTLFHKVRPQPLSIVVRISEDSGLAALIRDPAGQRPALATFDLVGRTCTPEQVLGGTHEAIARSLHQAYVRRQTELGETVESNPLLVPWQALPPAIQESNRQQVDLIGLQLESVGCEVVPLTDWDAAGFTLSDEEVELMARREHVRWHRERLEEGWRFAPGPKDLERRTHPALLPWEQLPDDEKAKNRDSVSQLPAMLASAGFKVFRVRTRNEQPASCPAGGSPAPHSPDRMPAGEVAVGDAAFSLTDRVVEQLAQAHHQVYVRSFGDRGRGAEYAALSADEHEQNRAAVRDIPRKLAVIGCRIIPGPPESPLFQIPEPDVERLAQMEHERWLEAARNAGGETHAVDGVSRPAHAAMVPWEDLPEPEKEKDRILVRSIPHILHQAGLAVDCADASEGGR